MVGILLFHSRLSLTGQEEKIMHKKKVTKEKELKKLNIPNCILLPPEDRDEFHPAKIYFSTGINRFV